MELTWSMFLIVCPLVFLAGFVDAIGGGGGLISLPAYFLAGVPVHHALATNKMSSASGTLISTIRLCRQYGNPLETGNSGSTLRTDRLLYRNQTDHADG